MAEVLTLLERIQRNQDDIIRRLVVSSMQLLAVCVCVATEGAVKDEYLHILCEEPCIVLEAYS